MKCAKINPPPKYDVYGCWCQPSRSYLSEPVTLRHTKQKSALQRSQVTLRQPWVSCSISRPHLGQARINGAVACAILPVEASARSLMVAASLPAPWVAWRQVEHLNAPSPVLLPVILQKLPHPEHLATPGMACSAEQWWKGLQEQDTIIMCSNHSSLFYVHIPVPITLLFSLFQGTLFSTNSYGAEPDEHADSLSYIGILGSSVDLITTIRLLYWPMHASHVPASALHYVV